MSASVRARGFTPLALAVILGALLHASTAWPHGGVVEEDDACIINIGFLRAHFKIYLPRERGHEQYCEDLPLAAESVFVMEYLHEAMDEAPIEFRVIRNTTGLGRFADTRDVAALGDLAPLTVFHAPEQVSPGVYAALHHFDAPGEYIGIVRATLPGSDTVHTAVFPFEVGGRRGYWLAAPLLVLLLLQWGWKRMGRRSSVTTSLFVGIVWLVPAAAFADAAESREGRIEMRWTSELEPLTINRLHAWTLRLHDADGRPLDGCAIEVDGGMPEHDHGLPTAPRVTATGSPGEYRVEGLRFHMPGEWNLSFRLDCGAVRDVARVDLLL